MWWSGLKQSEVIQGIGLIKNKLTSEEISGNTYWFKPETQVIVEPSPKVYLQQPYDEYGVAYKDRSAFFDAERANKVNIAHRFIAIFTLDGQVTGFWRRTIKKDTVEIEIDHFRELSSQEMDAFKQAAANYATFLQLKAKFNF